ncbi:MAG: DUF2809 domain-containing protein [Chitinophagaceae bacterium]|nr:MAG: DUF2809 domain-containing protein [Chitinophagaceae bacterium]
MVSFNSRYFASFLILLIVEVFIALYVRDEIVRPHIGDVLVVLLVYCFVKTFWNGPVVKTIICVLIFAYVIEIGQYFQLVKLLGLQQYPIARVVIGTSFSWIDIIAYSVGAIILYLLEPGKRRQLKNA